MALFPAAILFVLFFIAMHTLGALFLINVHTYAAALHITQRRQQCSNIGSIAMPVFNKPSGNYVAPYELSTMSLHEDKAVNT